jgi:UDP-glucuronate 4-epimerase
MNFRNIMNGTPISFFGDGTSIRDYTYISDIIDGLVASLSYSKSNYEIFNIGNNYGVSFFSFHCNTSIQSK